MVQMAFVASGKPGNSDWTGCTWETVNVAGELVQIADCQIGPNGGLVLAPGSYGAWVKVVDSPDIPVRQVGILQIT
jgi:hypothetical protein